MLVTVIIPVYNYEKYIGKAIENVLGQTYSNIECIVVDDGSTDRTKNIIKDYCKKDKRVKYIYQKNCGASKARNTGIKDAKGEIIQFLDADDLMEKTKIEYQVQIFKKMPYVDIVYGNYKYFKESLNEIDKSENNYDTWTPKICGKGEKIINAMIMSNIGMTHSLLVRKEMFSYEVKFDEKYRIFEDWKLWLTFSMRNAYFYFDGRYESMVYVRKGHASLQSKKKIMDKDYIRFKKWMYHEIINSEYSEELKQVMREEYVKTKGLRNIDLNMIKDKYMRKMVIDKIQKSVHGVFSK
jgi:glycosyltransferase involved in cell wall biosynthesis